MKIRHSRVHAVALDAEETIFFANQLTAIKAEVIEIQFPELKARTLIPMDFSTPEGAETIKYRVFEKVGMAKIISSYADDLPRTDIVGSEVVAVIRSIGASYGYSRQEIRAAQMAGVSLDATKARNCRESILRREDQTAWFGSSAHGISRGLLNNANMTLVGLPADGEGDVTDFVAKNSDQVIRDMNAIAAAPFEATFGIETPDTMLLPVSVWGIVTTNPRANTDTTILKFFLANSPWIKNVEWLNELTGIGDGGNDRILVYRRDPSRVVCEVPLDVTEYEPQQKGLEMVIPAESRTAGVIAKRPLSIAYTDDAVNAE